MILSQHFFFTIIILFLTTELSGDRRRRGQERAEGLRIRGGKVKPRKVVRVHVF